MNQQTTATNQLDQRFVKYKYFRNAASGMVLKEEYCF
jgi:hypothetical protein